MPIAAPFLRLTLGPSRQAAAVLCLVHAVAVVALWVAVDSRIAAMAGTAALVVLARPHLCGRALARGPAGVSLLEFREGGRVHWTYPGAPRVAWEIARMPLVAPWAVLLHLRGEEGERRSLWILSDAVGAEAHRRLRQHLRWGALSEAARSGSV